MAAWALNWRRAVDSFCYRQLRERYEKNVYKNIPCVIINENESRRKQWSTTYFEIRLHSYEPNYPLNQLHLVEMYLDTPTLQIATLVQKSCVNEREGCFCYRMTDFT
jgi:hypothetical protein